MNRYRVCGTVSVDIYAEIDAPTLEDALEYARDKDSTIKLTFSSRGFVNRIYIYNEDYTKRHFFFIIFIFFCTLIICFKK